MKEKLINLYDKLLMKYKIDNPVRLLLFSRSEYLSSEEGKRQLKLYSKENVIDTLAYYSFENNSIILIYDYFDEYEVAPIKNISKDILYCFSLIHEYRHVMQRRQKNSFIYYINLMEKSISQFFNNYNDQTHDDWYSEIDANLFAAKELIEIKDNYNKIDNDYISLMNYVYQYDLYMYNYDKLVEDYIKLIKHGKNIENCFSLLFEDDGRFKNLRNIIKNRDKLNSRILNIIITSKAFLSQCIKYKLDENEKTFLINQIKYRIKNESEKVFADSKIVSQLEKRIGINTDRKYDNQKINSQRLIKHWESCLKYLYCCSNEKFRSI